MIDYVKCKGCGRQMLSSVAELSREAIRVLKSQEGHQPTDVPADWRDGPLCNYCQATWSAAISESAKPRHRV